MDSDYILCVCYTKSLKSCNTRFNFVHFARFGVRMIHENAEFMYNAMLEFQPI